MQTNFNLLVGFAANFRSSENIGVGTNLSYISTTAPEIQPNSSIYLSMSNIQNKYANPSTIIFALSSNVGFGEQITELPPQYAWNTLQAGTYNTLRLQILGIDKTPLQIMDGNMTIVLQIRDTRAGGVEELLAAFSSGGK